MDEIDKRKALETQRALESRLNGYLEPVLSHRGFVLAPTGFGVDPDGRVNHQVLYHADPELYENRYPALWRRFDGDVSCIDLWIDLGEGSAVRRTTIEGSDLRDLLLEVDHPLPPLVDEGLDAQLVALAGSLRVVFDHFDEQRR